MDNDRLAALEQKLSDHIESEKETHIEMKNALTNIGNRVDTLCGYFEQGKGMIKLLAWIAAVGGAIAGAATFIKAFLTISLK